MVREESGAVTHRCCKATCGRESACEEGGERQAQQEMMEEWRMQGEKRGTCREVARVWRDSDSEGDQWHKKERA